MVSIAIKNSESLYFPNGDIVLLSLPKDSVMTAFRIDSVFLLRSSSVFEGMLSLPPSADIETYDNAPFVKLQDEEDDLTVFLMALYDPRSVPWKKLDSGAIRTVEGILLLATKYQVDHLRERIVDLLEQDWPSDLSSWDDNEAEIRGRKKNFDDYISRIGVDFVDKDTSMPDPCEAIRLARRCNLPSILPAAFYHLSRIPGIKDRRLSGPLANIIMSPYRRVLEGGRFADFSLLSAEDLRRLVVGREAILHISRSYLHGAYIARTYKHSSPSSPDECGTGMSKFNDWLDQLICSYDDDPLSMMKRDGDDMHFTKYSAPDTCAVCRERFLELLRDKRESLWELLPTIFMLDPPQ